MTTTHLDTSRWRLRCWGSDQTALRSSVDDCHTADPCGHRHRLAAIVDAAARIADIELLSSALDPSNGSIRIELLAPLLSSHEQLALEAQLRSAAHQDSRSHVTIDFEFVNPLLSSRIEKGTL